MRPRRRRRLRPGTRGRARRCPARADVRSTPDATRTAGLRPSREGRRPRSRPPRQSARRPRRGLRHVHTASPCRRRRRPLCRSLRVAAARRRDGCSPARAVAIASAAREDVASRPRAGLTGVVAAQPPRGNGRSSGSDAVELDAEPGPVERRRADAAALGHRLADEERREHRHDRGRVRRHHQELRERALVAGDDEVVAVDARAVRDDEDVVRAMRRQRS